MCGALSPSLQEAYGCVRALRLLLWAGPRSHKPLSCKHFSTPLLIRKASWAESKLLTMGFSHGTCPWATAVFL